MINLFEQTKDVLLVFGVVGFVAITLDITLRWVRSVYKKSDINMKHEIEEK